MLSNTTIPNVGRCEPPANSSNVDPTRCPICGEPNHCQRCIEGPDMRRCWCHEFRIPRSVFELIPPAAINRACVCQPCLMRLGATMVQRRNSSGESRE